VNKAVGPLHQGDAVRPVEARPGDGARAFATMIAQGARVAELNEIVA
jgi:hypothetical protein